MDNLNELPPKNDTVKTPEEEEVMDQFFPGGPSEKMAEVSSKSGKFSKLNWKTIGGAALLFLALANPWVDGIFASIPRVGSSPMAVTGMKTVIFVILLIVFCLFV